MLSEEQTKQIKSQLIQQIESTFPEDKKEFAKQQIEVMEGEELEEFLKQNKLIQTPKTQQSSALQSQQSIFRSIVSRQVPSHKIDENKNALAVLEINPASKGHIIIIPKEAVTSVEKIPQTVFSLAKKISKRLKSKLKSKEVNISSANVFGEFIINILPIYENESLNSERYKADESELQELQEKLERKTKNRVIKKPKKEKIKEKIILPKRIP